MAKGQKTCPECSAVQGCRAHKCKNCGHVFVTKRLRTTEVEDVVQDIESKDIVPKSKRKSKRSAWLGDKLDLKIFKDRAKFLDLSTEDDGNTITLIKPVILTKKYEPNLAHNSLPAKIEVDTIAKTVSVWTGMSSDGSPNKIFTGAL